jgi:hypothetical protein
MHERSLPRVRFITYEEIRREAEELLCAHLPGGKIPVHVELLVEYYLGVEIISVPRLRTGLQVDGFLSRDFRAIYVDAYTRSRIGNRFRFTLAHELGHRVLHKELYDAASYETPEGWLAFQGSISREDYGRYEFQASCFAGMLLLPKAPFAALVSEGVDHVRANGIQVDLATGTGREHVVAWVAQKADVSREVVIRQARLDAIWDADLPAL